MISGATGALAVVMVALVARHGVEYLFATVVLMGILQILAGIFHLGKFIRLVPYPVMLGFVNGLAIVIFLAQLSQFQVTGADGVKAWMVGWPLANMLGLVVLTMFIIWVMPKITLTIPAPLAGIGIVAGLVIYLGIDVPRVGDLASIKGGLPEFHIPLIPMTIENLKTQVQQHSLQKKPPVHQKHLLLFQQLVSDFYVESFRFETRDWIENHQILHFYKSGLLPLFSTHSIYPMTLISQRPCR